MQTMFTPRFEALLGLIGLEPGAYAKAEKITLDKDIFEFLVRVMVLAGEFDEAAYLEANEDVRAAMKRGEIKDAFVHYLNSGYFEGRDGAWPQVDEEWYLKRYPDVAKGVKAGDLPSGQAHYQGSGHKEWRIPGPQSREALAPWRAVLEMRGVTVD